MDVSKIPAQAELFKGILLHAGGSYGCMTRSDKVAAVETNCHCGLCEGVI